jgi:hypothetical protein
MSERLLDRATVDRVLRRASELSDDDDDEPELRLGSVSERALLEAAVEAGIPAQAVRRALAEERLDPMPRRRPGDRIVGSAVVAVDAEVDGSPAMVLNRLDAWFVEGHHLRRDRLRNGRGVWTKRPGLVGRTIRSVRYATGEGRLGRVRSVRASTGDTGIGTTMVRVEVDQDRARRTAASGAAAAGAATLGGVVLAVVAGPVALIAVPIGLAAGVVAASGGRSHATAVAREVDRVLDSVDQGIAPTRLRTDLVRRATGSGVHVDRRDVAPTPDA